MLAGLGALGVLGLAMASDDAAPVPHMPPGPPTPLPRPNMARPRPPRDATDAPDELFVERDCSDWTVGPAWDERHALPAIQAWLAAGWDDPNEWHHHTVVREVLAPYVQCIDAFPWIDQYAVEDRPPPDLWVQQWRAVEARYPQVANLIQVMLARYSAVRSGLIR